MYGIYANIWGILMVNVTTYSIHGSYGIYIHLCHFCHFAIAASVNARSTCNACDENRAVQYFHQQNHGSLILAVPLATWSNQISIGAQSKTGILQSQWFGSCRPDRFWPGPLQMNHCFEFLAKADGLLGVGSVLVFL